MAKKSKLKLASPEYTKVVKVQPAWEKSMPKSGYGHRPMLLEIVLDKVSYFSPKMVSDIHQEVNDDYGNIDIRNVYNYLNVLKRTGFIKSIFDDEVKNQFSYIRTGKWSDPRPSGYLISKINHKILTGNDYDAQE